MAITLNHTIVPARDKEAAARQFAQLFGLTYEGLGEHFAPVKVNDGLTFLFDDDTNFESHQDAGLTYGSAPWSANDKKLNHWGGGRGVYFRTLDGHLLELMTVPQ
jgi:catechol 2,3-dioxygenase-like lactoylglutathione lyase family enzyme